MASISSLGVGSGLDLASIVSGLVSAERAPVENRLAFNEENITTELSAFGFLRSSLYSFQGTLSSLSSSSTYNAKGVSLSDSSVFSASVANNADEGNYAVEVSALANSHSIASSATSVFSGVNDVVGTGTLAIRFGTTTNGPYAFTHDTSKATQNITVSAANNNTTLSGLRDYINDNDYGVQAAIVNDGTGYRLTLTSENSGAANSMEITVTGDGDSNDTDNVGLSQLAFNASAQTSMTQTVAAQDAALSINGLSITRETNTVIGAINGVTLNLTKADIGNTVNMSVTENKGDIIDSITNFVEGFNDLKDAVNTLTNYNPDTSTAGILLGDFTVRSLNTQLRNIISNTLPQLTGSIRALADIGITTNSDGTLNLDTAKLNDTLSSYPSEVEALFAFQGRPSDAEINYSAATDDTQAGNYPVNITTLATQGVYNGTTLNSLVIDANNDVFSIQVDGITSSTINLTQSTYSDGAALATHIQAQINDDDNLKAEGVSVSVVYDTINNELDITSTRYGAESTVEFTSIDTNTSNDLGFSVSSGIDGVDVAGTINGFSASGNGQLLTSTGGDSNGLALLITAGSTGSRGSVSFSRGVAEAIDSLLGHFLDSDGLLDSREDGLNKKLKEIFDERNQLDLRVSKLEARLIQQFSALDSLIARFNNTSSFLSTQLANLPKPNSINNNS